MDRSSDFIQSLERGLAVIRTFGADRPTQTLTEASKAAGLSKATARRCLYTLVDLGYANFDGRLFSLRAKVLELGYSFLSGLALPDLARSHLEALSARVDESCSMAVLDGDEVVYVARIATRRIMSISIAVGSRFPAHLTSMGRVLMAAESQEWVDGYLERTELRPVTRHTISSSAELTKILRQVRTQGFALNDQELEDGVRSIAVPLRNSDGVVLAALNISTSALRRTLDDMQRSLLPELRLTATAIEADLPTG